jgi:prophage regulatory protein
MSSNYNGTIRFLRLPQVIERVGLSRSTIYSLIDQGRFPPAIPLSVQARAWSSKAIEEWMQERLADGDTGPAKSA